jgi:hypothetical protein
MGKRPILIRNDAAVAGLPMLLEHATGMREGSRAADIPVAVFVTELLSELAVAARHVAQGRVIVARQRERIARLKAQGSSTRDHELTLDLFVSTLQILEEHERALRSSAEKLAAETRRRAH